MLNIARMPLLAVGLVGFAMAAAPLALAQDNSSSTTQSTLSTPTEATNPSNLPASKSGQTQQQSAAPVVDPHAAAQTPSNTQSQPGQLGTTQNTNTQEWPAPERYDSGRGASGNASTGQGGASLGVNVVGSEDGQGIVVSRIRPGTPADQMGLRPRDRILSLNGQPVGSVEGFIAAIRGMSAGDQVQLSIDRGGNTRDIAGRLEAFREAVAAGQGPVGNIVGRARDFIRDSSERIDVDAPAAGVNVQTSFEDRGQTSRQSSSDIEARLSRLEQQLDRLTREIQQLQSNVSTSPAAARQPGGASSQPTNR